MRKAEAEGEGGKEGGEAAGAGAPKRRGPPKRKTASTTLGND